jgi:hypothetical protein
MIGVVAFAQGCVQGKVELDSVEDFGRVESAVWLRLDDGEEFLEAIALSTAPRLCKELQEALPAYDAIVDDEGLDQAEIFDAGAALMESFLSADQKLIYFYTWGTEPESYTSELGPGEWAVVDGDGDFILEFVAYSGNPLEAAAAAERAGEDANAAAEGVMSAWHLGSDGDLRLEAEGDDKLSGTVEGSLSDYDGSAAGTISASFDASFCDVPADPGILLQLFL